MYAWLMGDVERKINAATKAGEVAYESVRAMPGSTDRADAANRLSKNLRGVADKTSDILHAEVRRFYHAEGPMSFSRLGKRFGISKTLAHRIVTAGNGSVSDEEEEAVTEPSTIPEPQPVVAAIVTSARGVLIGRRNDGKPPWTFISGEIEPGESPADAAVREVKEETGLRVTAGGVIGRRNHPKTGRHMVYMAAKPVRGTDVFVGDEDELSEVRWVSLDEALELMGDMFEPVHQHLRGRIASAAADFRET
jgi:8-oxo-dGTP pyrophosphatase MutT (NUDIX family)